MYGTATPHPPKRIIWPKILVVPGNPWEVILWQLSMSGWPLVTVSLSGCSQKPYGFTSYICLSCFYLFISTVPSFFQTLSPPTWITYCSGFYLSRLFDSMVIPPKLIWLQEHKAVPVKVIRASPPHTVPLWKDLRSLGHKRPPRTDCFLSAPQASTLQS